MGSYVGTKAGDTTRVRTGYEKVIAHRVSDEFAVSADGTGKVISIDEKLKLIKVRYNEHKDTYVYEFGERISNNTANGFFTTQHIKVNPKLKKGSTIRQGDFIVYNEDFFQIDPISGDMNCKTGINSNVAFLESDVTIEDSSGISKELAAKLQFRPAYQIEIKLSKRDNLYEVTMPGDSIKSTDPILLFDQSDMATSLGGDDKELIGALQELGRTAPRAKHTGVVSKIEIIYNCPLSEMTPSMRKLTKTLNEDTDKKADFVKGTAKEAVYPKAGPLTVSAKLGTTLIDDEVVILRFYIVEDNDMGIGSKIVVSSSLKTITAQILPDMLCEDGVTKVDAMSSARGINARIIMSPLLTGTANRVLIDLEKQVLTMAGVK